MTPALKLFEHLADFSEEQPAPVVESFEEEGFVPLVEPAPQDPDLTAADPFDQPDVLAGLDDPVSLEPALDPLGDELGSVAPDSDALGLDSIMPAVGDDPLEQGLESPIGEIGLGEADTDPFGLEPVELVEPAAELDPFAADSDPFGADTLLPAAEPLESEIDPFASAVGLDGDAGEMALMEAEPGGLPADLDMSSELPSLPQDDPAETTDGQDEIPADDPVLTEALDTFGEPQPENDLASLASEPESLQETPVDSASMDAEAQLALVKQIQEETENRIAQGFATALADAEEKLTERVCSSVAGILAGILNDELVRNSVEALAGRLHEISGSAGALRVDVRGPASLFESLKAALGENAPELRFTEDDNPDLTIEVDSQIVSSRIGEWRQSIEGCFS